MNNCITQSKVYHRCNHPTTKWVVCRSTPTWYILASNGNKGEKPNLRWDLNPWPPVIWPVTLTTELLETWWCARVNQMWVLNCITQPHRSKFCYLLGSLHLISRPLPTRTPTDDEFFPEPLRKLFLPRVPVIKLTFILRSPQKWYCFYSVWLRKCGYVIYPLKCDYISIIPTSMM